MDRCKREIPPFFMLNGDHQAACFLHDDQEKILNIDD
jgi:hypothetical protein